MLASQSNPAIEKAIAKISNFYGAVGIPNRKARVKSRHATKPSDVALHYEVSDDCRAHDTSR